MADDRAEDLAASQPCDFGKGCAVVFGAAGAIGAQVARAFATAGSDVALMCRSLPGELAVQLGEPPFTQVTSRVFVCDITDPANVSDAVNSAHATFGGIHSVALCQGAKHGTGTVADGPIDQLRLKLEIDLFGFLNAVQAAVPLMRAEGGSITAIVTPAIDKKSKGYGLASAPKVVVAKLIEYLALEEGHAGIRANAVAPGVLDGGMASKIDAGPASAIIAAALEQTPLGRSGGMHEVADLIVFLASRRAGYITGQIIDIDGGYSL